MLDEHTYRHRARQLLALVDAAGAGVKKIAIVPAYNEQGAIGGVIDEIRAFDPEFDVLVVDDGSHDRDGGDGARTGARVVALPFNLGIGGAVQTGFRYACEHGFELAARVDGDGQHDPAELAPLIDAVARGEADICVGSRFVGRRGLPIVRYTARRHPHPRAHRLAADRAARHRHDERLPGAEPQGDQALRSRLSARLPRGRGRADAAQAPPAADRGAGGDARARGRPLVDPRPSTVYYMVKVMLAILVGALAAARRRWRTRDPRRSGRRSRSRSPRRPRRCCCSLVVFELIRSRRLRERYALLWLLTGLVLLALSAWRGGLNTIAGWVGVETYPPAVLFAVALLFILAVLLHYSTVISKVTDQNVILAQRVALLELELSERRRRRRRPKRRHEKPQRAEQHRDRRRGERERLPERRVVVARRAASPSARASQPASPTPPGARDLQRGADDARDGEPLEHRDAPGRLVQADPDRAEVAPRRARARTRPIDREAPARATRKQRRRHRCASPSANHGVPRSPTRSGSARCSERAPVRARASSGQPKSGQKRRTTAAAARFRTARRRADLPRR